MSSKHRRQAAAHAFLARSTIDSPIPKCDPNISQCISTADGAQGTAHNQHTPLDNFVDADGIDSTARRAQAIDRGSPKRSGVDIEGQAQIMVTPDLGATIPAGNCR